MEITFEQLPQAVSGIYRKLEDLEKLINKKSNESQPEKDEFLSVRQAAIFLKLSVTGIYGLIQKGQIPYMKPKGSKRIYFSKFELTDFLKEGRIKTKTEVDENADSFLSGLKKNGK